MEKNCVHCGKKYSKKTSYEKHILLCDILHKNEKERNTYTPLNQRDMIHIIETLATKCAHLERKVDELSKWVRKEKKKLDIIEWLQNQSSLQPQYTFDELKATHMRIENKHIEIVKERTLMECLHTIFTDSFQSINPPPIICFTNKPNVFYICDSIYPKPQWRESDNASLIVFWNEIQKKLLFLISEWKKNNQERFENSDKECEIYGKTMIKLLVSFREMDVMNKTKHTLFDVLKKDIKSMVEYEI
jgi:predicted phosphatase